MYLSNRKLGFGRILQYSIFECYTNCKFLFFKKEMISDIVQLFAQNTSFRTYLKIMTGFSITRYAPLLSLGFKGSALDISVEFNIQLGITQCRKMAKLNISK